MPFLDAAGLVDHDAHALRAPGRVGVGAVRVPIVRSVSQISGKLKPPFAW
jgi:hypothetical protein